MKKIYKIILTLSICISLYSCNDKKSSSESSTSVKTDKPAVTEISGETDDSAAHASQTLSTEMSPDRENKDFDSLKKTASELFEQYYKGIKQENADLCFSVFPDFYIDALTKESEECNQTNDEYIVDMNSNFKNTYGGDYYAYSDITAILQLYDKSLLDLQKSINESFDNDIVLEDAYSVYVTQTARGSSNKGSQEYEYFLLKIDGKFYLYDSYYEKQ